MKYSVEELASLAEVFLRSQYFAFCLFSEVHRQELKSGGKDEATAARKVRYLGDVYLGYMSELFTFFRIRKDTSFLARLKSSKAQQDKLGKIRDSAFHVTTISAERRRFDEFQEGDKEGDIFKDSKTIGDHIFTLIEQNDSRVAEEFRRLWAEFSPYDLSKEGTGFKKGLFPPGGA